MGKIESQASDEEQQQQGRQASDGEERNKGK
jgi:hypothetical protein